MRLYTDEAPQTCEACPLKRATSAGKPKRCKLTGKPCPEAFKLCPLESLPPKRAVFIKSYEHDPADIAAALMMMTAIVIIVLTVIFVI